MANYNEQNVPNKKKNNVGSTIFVAIVAIGLLSAIWYVMSRSYIGVGVQVGTQNVETTNEFTETDVKLEYSLDSAASFYAVNNGNFFFSTKDGIKFMDSSGRKIWEDVFTMTSPILHGEGDFAIVCEAKGKSAYVYNASGRLYSSNFEGAILNVSINEIGYSSIICKTTDGYETQIFNELGVQISVVKHKDENVFPICSDISNDGRVLAVSLLDINNVSMKSQIVFSYLKVADSKTFSDGIFASLPKEGKIVGQLYFQKDGVLIAFSDAEITTIAIEAGSKITSVDKALDNKIEKLGFFSDGGFVAGYGETIVGKNGASVGKIEFYNDKTVDIAKDAIDKKPTYLNATGKNAIVCANRHFTAFNSKGKMLWQYVSSENFEQAIMLENSETVLFVGSTNALVMKRSR